MSGSYFLGLPQGFMKPGDRLREDAQESMLEDLELNAQTQALQD